MQVQAHKLEDHLQNEALACCWLISGDEVLLVEEALGCIRVAAHKAGITARQTLHTEARFDWQSLVSETNSASLFAAQRLLEVRIHKGSLDKTAAAALLEILPGLDESLILVLVMPKLEGRAAKTQWYKQLTQRGVHVPVWPVSVKEMPNWLKRRAKAAGLKLTEDGLEALQYRVVGNLLAADQEIKKLKLFAGDTLWDADQINKMMGDSSRFTVFDLLDASLAGRTGQALKMLRRLALEGEMPLRILALIQRELGNLRTMRTAVDAGTPIAQVMKQHYVFYQRTAATEKALNRLSVARLEGLQARLAWVDQSAKGALRTDVWEILENLITGLGGKRRLAPLAQASGRLLLHPDFTD